MAIQQLPRRAEPTSLRKKADSPDDFDAVLDSMAADTQIASEADAKTTLAAQAAANSAKGMGQVLLDIRNAFLQHVLLGSTAKCGGNLEGPGHRRPCTTAGCKLAADPESAQ